MIRGFHATSEYLCDSSGQKRSEPPFLDWLLQDTESTNVCYDLDAFAACLFRLLKLTREECVMLLEKEKLWLDSYTITYYAGRYLSVAKGHGQNRPYVFFSDMSRYIEQVTHNPDECPVEKAKLAQKTGEAIQAALKEIGGGVDTEAVGSITRMLKPVLKHLNVPTHLDYPLEVVQMAIDNVKGNWVEAYKLGHFNAYDLDMSGAYASFLANLPDTRWGTWEETNELDNMALGFASGKLTRRESFSPFLYRNDNGLHGVVGMWDETLNQFELNYIAKYKRETFHISNGWKWTPSAPPRYPYKGLVNWLWQKRQSSTGLTKDLVKRMMAYLWGQTLADYGSEFGEWYNPVYGAMVERGCAVKVADFVVSNKLEQNLCHIAVDGAMFDCPVTLQNQQGLGEWRISYTAPTIIVNSGYVFVQGKAGLQEFAHNYDWLKGMLDEYPEADSYERGKWVIVSLAEAILRNKLEEMGKPQWTTERIHIGQDTKRLYLDAPANGRELMSGVYSSKPLHIDMIRAMEG